MHKIEDTPPWENPGDQVSSNPQVMIDAKAKQKLFTDAFQQSVLAAAENFTAKWNSKNPSGIIQIRFVLSNNKITNHPRFKAQAVLTFEILRKFQWNVMSRVTLEYPTMQIMMKHEDDATFELWMKMFDELTQIGFASVVSYLNEKEDSKQGIAQGNIQAAENEGV